VLLDTAHRWTSAVNCSCGAVRGSGCQEVGGAWKRRTSADDSSPRSTCLGAMVGPRRDSGGSVRDDVEECPRLSSMGGPQALCVSQHTITPWLLWKKEDAHLCLRPVVLVLAG